MTQKIYDPSQTSTPKTPTVDYDGLKKAHKEALNDAIETFKTKAFGDQVQDCIQKIEKEVMDRYKVIKTKFLFHSEA